MARSITTRALTGWAKKTDFVDKRESLKVYGGQQEVIKWSGERCEARIRGIVSNGKRMVVVEGGCSKTAI